MPFTFSHPAAIIPVRRFGVLSALVIGSMMPDTLYFMPFGSVHESYGHTLPGIFFYCVPAGLFLLWIFHAFLKLPLIALFPANQQGKLLAASREFSFTPGSRFFLIALSVCAGAATHVIWDAFTHTGSPVAQYFPILRRFVMRPPHFFYVAELLQWISSVFGLAVIALFYWRWLKTADDLPVRVHLSSPARVFLLVLFFVGAVVPSIVRFTANTEFWLSYKRGFIGRGVMDGIKIACVELLIFSVIWHLAVGTHQTDATPASHSS